MGKTRKYFAAAGLSGLLLGLAYPGWGFDLGWLAWVGLVPMLLALRPGLPRPGLGNPRPGLGFGFKIGFIVGLVYFLIVFRWFWSAYPLDTIGIQGRVISLLGIGAIYLVSSAGMALFWGLFGLAFGVGVRCQMSGVRFKTWNLEPGIWNLFLLVPALFVLLEYLRSWGFGFLWAGSGSLFGPHWTLGNLAYALADNHLALKLASSIGIYGITFLIIFINILLFLCLREKKRQQIGVAVIILIALISIPKLLRFNSDTPVKKINYAIIQTYQLTKLSPSPQETLASFTEQLKLLDKVAKKHPEGQLIVFPEASDFFKNLSLFLTPTQVQDYFSKLFKEPHLIIAGSRIMDSTTGKAYSRVFSLDTKDDIIGYYDKRLVAPGGEFLPYTLKILVSIFSKNAYSLFSQVRDLHPGQKEVSTVGFRYQFNVAPIICSEVTSPSLIRKTTSNSDVIVSMASYGAFHGNRTIAEQMLALTRFRAAENRKPVITAANMGRSYVIDSYGNVSLLAQDADARILTGSVDITASKSWYNKAGDTPILLGSLVLGILGFRLQVSGYRGKIKSWFRRNRE